jgi:hypothetical protein
VGAATGGVGVDRGGVRSDAGRVGGGVTTDCRGSSESSSGEGIRDGDSGGRSMTVGDSQCGRGDSGDSCGSITISSGGKGDSRETGRLSNDIGRREDSGEANRSLDAI